MQRTTTAISATGETRPWWQAGLATGAVAAIFNAVLFGLYQLVTGAPLQTPPFTGGPPQDLPLAVVIVSSMIPVLIATLLAAGLYRWLVNGRAWFIGISAVAALLSLGSPLSLPGTSLGNNATLAAMHLIAGAVTIVMLAPRFPADRA